MQLEVGVDPLVLTVSALLLLAVLTAALAARPGGRFRIPGALLFLAIGMAVGDDGLGLVPFDDTGLVRSIGVVALLLILFEGGLTTKPSDLRTAALPGLALATVGVLITAAVTGVGVWLLLGVDVVTAGLIGSVVASTDAAAVFSTMRRLSLPRRVAAVVRIESGANDPIAVMLTVGLITTLEGGAVGAGGWLWFAVVQLLGGLAVGAVVGAGGVWLLRRVDLGVAGLYPILAASVAGVAYGVAATLGASGFVAVYLAGLLIGGKVPRHRRAILGFHEAMANAAEVGLFLVLGLLVFPSELPAVAVPALAVAGVLILVARPAAVWLCTLGTGFRWQERSVIGWAGLRGAVPIVLATFPPADALAGDNTLFNVVFFVVLVSVLLQGTTLQALVQRVGLEELRPAWAPVAEALPLEDVDVDLVELTVTSDLTIAGRLLSEVGSPGLSRVSAIVRDQGIVVPTGATRLQVGDVLLLTCPRDRRRDIAAEMTAWARGEADPDEPGAAEHGGEGDGR
ncbi:MAG: potassium/proton antiporter [Nitriliruptoraceae bacterium]